MPYLSGSGDPKHCKALPHGNCKNPHEKASYKKVEDLWTNSPTVSPVKGDPAIIKAPPFLPQPKRNQEEIKKRINESKGSSASQIFA